MNFYYSLFYSFITYAFLGWVLEVLYHLYTQKRFVNRGFLHGPLCPIYGSTAVLLIVLLTPYSNNILFIFILGALAASIVEFVTGYLLELFFSTKWWDYSNEKFNLNGYICLRFSAIWGVLSVIFVKIINPHVSQVTYWIMSYFGEILYNIILVLLVGDIVLTVNSLITFNKLFNELQDILLETRSNMDKLMERTISLENRLNLQHRISFLEDINERLTKRVSLRHKAMLRAYPHITSKRFGTVLDEIKKRFEAEHIKRNNVM